MNILEWYNNFRKKTFPPSINDLSWRHEVVERNTQKILLEIDRSNKNLLALSNYITTNVSENKTFTQQQPKFDFFCSSQSLSLPFYNLSSQSEFEIVQADMSRLKQSSDDIEKKLVEKNKDNSTYYLDGFCIVCDSTRKLKVDYECLGDYNLRQPNFRERLVCESCNLNNRMRAYVHLLTKNFSLKKEVLIYVTEQTTDLFIQLQRHFPLLVGSEFLADGTKNGNYNTDGIRHEDATQLSFKSNTFEVVLSFECLEHIPNYRAALSEFSRVLQPGGLLMISAPFEIARSTTLVRAIIEPGGNIKHLESPEYHGDPINGEGILCLYHFGWDILNDIRESGFSTASALIYNSPSFGYLGGPQTIFVARK